eukprot:2227196-Alexandrium_andersonii.AAC.1
MATAITRRMLTHLCDTMRCYCLDVFCVAVPRAATVYGSSTVHTYRTPQRAEHVCSALICGDR